MVLIPAFNLCVCSTFFYQKTWILRNGELSFESGSVPVQFRFSFGSVPVQFRISSGSVLVIDHPLSDVLFFIRYVCPLDCKSFQDLGAGFQFPDRFDGTGEAASLVRDKDVDSLSGQIMRVQEREDRHGQIAPPVGEDKIDRVVILNSLFISFQHRSEALILFLLSLVDCLIVVDRIGILCQDLHCFTPGFLCDPGRDLTGISHKAILIYPDTCAGIRVNIRGKIRVAYSAEIDSKRIADGSAAFSCFRRCGMGLKR